jgi:hypothetical protein
MKKVTFATVRQMSRHLPDVEETTTWGCPALKVKGKMFACVPSHKSAEPGSLVVRLDFAQRDALVAEEPDIFYFKEHYENYPCVLVRLAKVTPDMLRGLLETAYKFVQKGKRPRRAV